MMVLFEWHEVLNGTENTGRSSNEGRIVNARKIDSVVSHKEKDL